MLATTWYAWWVKYAWQHDLSPQFVPIIAAPFGIDLSKDITRNISLSFANYPLLVLTFAVDEIFAYNFLMLFTFPMAGMAMYFLTYYFTRHKWASFFAGLAFAFCPYHFAHASHITLANIQWMPLFVLFLFKTHDKRTFANAALCGLFFALTLLSDTYYGYFMLILAIAFIGYKTFRKLFFRKRVSFAPKTGFIKNISLIATAGFIGAVVCFLYVFPLLKAYLVKSDGGLTLHNYVRNIRILYDYSAKLFSYIIPASNHPLFGSFTYNLRDSIFYGDLQEGTLYLGLTTIFLSIFGFRFWKNNKRHQITDLKEKEKYNFYLNFFAFLAIAAFSFSLSPEFMLFGKEIKMPSYYFFQILPFFRSIARFGIVVLLSLCVLAGFGFKFITERISGKGRKIAVGTLLIGLLLFEFANIPPFRTSVISKSEDFSQWLKSQQEVLLVAEYPLDNDVEYFFNQRIHQKKLVNGAIPNTEAYSAKEKIEDLLKPGTVKILKDFGVDFVILHIDKYKERSRHDQILEEMNNFEKKYGLILVKDFDNTKVYKIKRDSKR
ncbi:MAG: hypothetical protein ABH836_02755 [Candidatus Omnitrophota bacterium]